MRKFRVDGKARLTNATTSLCGDRRSVDATTPSCISGIVPHLPEPDETMSLGTGFGDWPVPYTLFRVIFRIIYTTQRAYFSLSFFLPSRLSPITHLPEFELVLLGFFSENQLSPKKSQKASYRKELQVLAVRLPKHLL